MLALAQDCRPGEARLEAFEHQPLEERPVVVAGDAPLLVVVGDHQRVGADPFATLPRLGHPAASSR